MGILKQRTQLQIFKMKTKARKNKIKPNKSVTKRIKVTGTGKIMRSHQLRSGHLRRNKSKSALRRHSRPIEISKTGLRAIKRMLGISG